MRVYLGLLITTSFFVFSPLGLKTKPRYLKVTHENHWELGVPLGTVLKLDKLSKLYQPPPITDRFTPDDRIKLMWNNQNTRNNYCKVGPGVDSARFFYNFWWYQWCKNSTGHDVCCKGHKCSCNLIKKNCACLTPEGAEYWERKKEVDWNNVKAIWETVKKPFIMLYKSLTGSKKNKTDEGDNQTDAEVEKSS